LLLIAEPSPPITNLQFGMKFQVWSTGNELGKDGVTDYGWMDTTREIYMECPLAGKYEHFPSDCMKDDEDISDPLIFPRQNLPTFNR
jgi:hypothetical protein